MIHLISQTGFADLVETLELVEAHGKAIGHDHPVKEDRHTLLTHAFELAHFSQKTGALWHQEALMIMRIDVGRHQAVDRSRQARVQAIGENSFDHRAFKEPVFLSMSLDLPHRDSRAYV